MSKGTLCGGDLGSGLYDDMSGHCYVAVEAAQANFWEARRACVEAGGDLFSLDADDGMQPASLGEVWVGLADLSPGDNVHEFLWLGDGAVGALTFTADEDQIKLRCAIRNQVGQLDDKICDQDKGYVCELTLGNP
jgi:hypothetical protein